MDSFQLKISEAKKLFKEQGFEKIQDLAKKMDLLPNTLTSNLKYIIKNERFETGFAKKLFESINVTKNEFVKKINKPISTYIKSPLKFFENRSEILNRIAETYQSEIINLIENLSNGDTYTLVTTEEPWEFKNFFLQEIILNAIKRGVSFRYIYPLTNEATINVFEKHEDGFVWQSLDVLHESYLKKMLKDSLKDGEFFELDNYRLNSEKYIKRSLQAWFIDDVALVHPRLKTIIVTKDKDGEDDDVLAFSEVTFGDSFVSKNNKPNSLWYPLPNNDTILLNNLVQKIINE